METVRGAIEWIAFAIELLAVVVIVVAIIGALVRSERAPIRRPEARSDVFSKYKRGLGQGLLLALELLLAADIISTVTAPPTLQSLATLGLLAVIRTFLSWSLEVEIHGAWPWRMRAEERTNERAESAAK